MNVYYSYQQGERGGWMFTRINSGGIWAVEGVLVSVEADVSDGLPGFSISGQLASEVRESQDRVRTALKNSGFRLPAKKITVNLSPAGIRKGGTCILYTSPSPRDTR